MVIKILAITCGIILTLLPFFIQASKSLKTALIIVGLFFIGFSGFDIYITSETEAKNSRTIDSLGIKISTIAKRDSATMAHLENSINKFGLKISGDSVIRITTFVTNSTTNVKSEHQKGGQTAGTIINH